MSKQKYNVNDTVLIIANDSQHGFELGTEVTLTKDRGDGIWEAADKDDYWRLFERDFTSVKKQTT